MVDVYIWICNFGHKIFRLAHIRYLCDKCIVFARNCKVANLIQYNMQYIPCNNDLLAQESLLLTQKSSVSKKSA